MDQKTSGAFDRFDRFEPGFEILGTGRGELEDETPVIAVDLSRRARKDQFERPFAALLINTEDGWKIHQYIFPDLIDY